MTPEETLTEVKRIRRYAGRPLPELPEARLYALEDRILRVHAWLRNLADDLEVEMGPDKLDEG